MSSSQPRRKPRLAAKAVSMVYGYPGELVPGWEARPSGKDEYTIHRHNGTTRTVKIGEHIQVREPGSTVPTPAIVTRSESGVLMVGNKSVVIGSNIKHGYQARLLAKDVSSPNAPPRYLLMSDTNQQLGRVSVGGDFNGHPVSLVDGHLLKVGEDIIPVVPKKHDITMLVMAVPSENGYLTYINTIEAGNGMNRKDGAKGSLIPPKNQGEPALFYEVFGGKLVVTARFWAEKNGKKLTYQFRDGELALKELKLQTEANEARNLAIEAGIEPEEFAEYTEAMELLSAIRSQWTKGGMAIISGNKIFEPHDPKREFDARSDEFDHPGR